ncbi:MAG: hypothetical protein HYS39_01255 [Proteobacteria bacterium]|nr:hypothetical protein [Pseudomonadota bacterium]
MNRSIISLFLLGGIVSVSAETSMTSVLSSMEPKKSATIKKKQTSKSTQQVEAVPSQNPQVSKKKSVKSNVKRAEADKWTAEYNKRPLIPTPSKETPRQLDPRRNTTSEPTKGLIEAKDRMENLEHFFQNESKQGVRVAFNALNGSIRLEHHERAEQAAILGHTETSGPLMCVANSSIVVSGDPSLINKEASIIKDVEGREILPMMVSALQNAPDHKATIEYYLPTDIKDPMNNKRTLSKKMVALIYGSKALMGKKNDSGIKFLCYIPVEAM